MLKKLEDLRGFTMAAGSPDIRGWDVYDKNGARIGCVDSMLVDTRLAKGNRMLVRYLSIKIEDMDHLIPIEKSTLDKDNRRINLPDYDRNALMSAPEYHGEAYKEDEACRIRDSFFKEEKEFLSAEPEKREEETVEFTSAMPHRTFSDRAKPEVACKAESREQRANFLEWKRRQR